MEYIETGGHSDGRILFIVKCAGRNRDSAKIANTFLAKRRYFLSKYQRYCDLDCFPQGDDADSAAGGFQERMCHLDF